MSKFWSSLCYFLGIKTKLFIAFHAQTDMQTQRQNSMMEAYLCVFVNWKQIDWARLLLMVAFAYNNSKNASMGQTLFKLNCGYNLWVSFQDKCNTRSRSSSTNGLAMELRELMNVCCQNLLHAQDLQK